MDLSQYNVILVNLDPTIGSEIKKTRPCIIISPDEMNKYLNTLVVAPMTTSSKKYPTRVPILHNKTQGFIALDKIRIIDKQRVVNSFNKTSSKTIQQIKAVLKEIYID